MGGTRFANPSLASSFQLHRNRGDGTFEEVTAEAGLHWVGWASSATVGDVDNDGDADLFVTFRGRHARFLNGGGGFAEVTEVTGFADEDVRWGSGTTFLD